MPEDIKSDFGKIPEKDYIAMINTPSRSREYFEAFHKPLVERALSRTKPINLLDVACGYCHELDFMADDPAMRLFGLDKSDDVLRAAKRRLPQIYLIHADVRFSPLNEKSMDAAIGVNAVVYYPEHMLQTMHHSLKEGSEAVVNFRDFSNLRNKPFYEYYLADGAALYDDSLNLGKETFALKVLDYRKCADGIIRRLDRQVYFQGKEAIERFIVCTGFETIGHAPFRFSSPANPDNEMDVYTLRKLG